MAPPSLLDFVSGFVGSSRSRSFFPGRALIKTQLRTASMARRRKERGENVTCFFRCRLECAQRYITPQLKCNGAVASQRNIARSSIYKGDEKSYIYNARSFFHGVYRGMPQPSVRSSGCAPSFSGQAYKLKVECNSVRGSESPVDLPAGLLHPLASAGRSRKKGR